MEYKAALPNGKVVWYKLSNGNPVATMVSFLIKTIKRLNSCECNKNLIHCNKLDKFVLYAAQIYM